MACKYIYKGHEFKSEVALDDFLIENKLYESILGDIVFSSSTKLNEVHSTLIDISKRSEELQKKYKEWERLKKMIYTEDGDQSFDQPPYIGVNKFLSGLKNENGELLFPQFIKDNYWNGRFSRWKNGDFTNPDGKLNQAEIEEFGIDPKNPPKITDRKLLENMRDQMEKRWEIQAKTGTAIHNVLQIIFTKDKNGKYNFELSDADLIEVINKNIEHKNKLFLNEKTIKLTIQYGRKLLKDLMNEFGENLLFFPEFTISLKANVVGKEPIELLGIIDLLIVDKEGRIHILDYKTSVHAYSDFSSAKKSAYRYQMAVYQRMLEKYGISTYQGKFMVSPIQIKDFKKNGDTYTYDGIDAPESFVPMNLSLNLHKMWDNIDEFMPSSFKLSVTGLNVGEKVSEWMSVCFPSYSSMRQATELQVIKFLKKIKKLTPDLNGLYSFLKEGKEGTITASSETEFVLEVTKYIQSRPHHRLRLTGDVKNAIKNAIKNGINNVDWPDPGDLKLGEESDRDWLKNTLSKYCNGLWEVYDNEIAEKYGIIILKTKDAPGIPNQVDFIRVSTSNLTQNFREYLDKKNPNKNRKGLTGTFETDVQALSKSDNLMVQAINGNVELMETLAVIDLLDGFEDCTFGEFLIVSPSYAKGMVMSNEELLYCYKELNKHKSIGQSKILSETYKFASKSELAYRELANILLEGEKNNWKDEYRHFQQFKSCIPNYLQFIDANVEDKIEALLLLLNKFKGSDYLLKKTSGIYVKLSDLKSIPISLHNKILIAISLLKGVNFRQLISDHDKWLESIFIHRNGISGSYIDNPGNLNSETLNLITNLTTQAYQNVRDDLLREKVKISKLIEDIKKESRFGYIKEHTFGNQASIYSDMYEVTPDGNFLFVKPNKLVGAKKVLLEYALNEINKRRFPGKTQEELDNMKNNGNVEYYEVPLALGGSDSLYSEKGLFSMLRAKFSYLMPKKVFERALAKVRGLYDKLYESEEDTQNKSLLLFEMSNMFDYGQGPKRIDKIKKTGVLNLEHNLETLLLKHSFAYSLLKNMDQVFPMIKSAMVHLTTQGAILNNPFKLDILYFKDYVRNKIFNESIVNEKFQSWVNVASVIKSAASKLTLAFAPVQMLYQPLQGLWLDISLMIRKPDGKDSFTFKHFLKATKLVYGDFFHYSDKPTICKLLNELYGINDMDMNTYIDRISSAKKGFWNFENLMFKFASRPDFYNRMTIFTSLMMGDGCLEAHSIDSNGQLVYDWKLDKRFNLYATGNKSNLAEYNKQKALYYEVASQFVKEHAMSKDGKTPFVLNMDNPNPLPRAYTNKEAESMKSLGDNIYGYYSHEKKSLVMSTALGSMWLLFKTYWSGKKNQYLQSGGVKLQGKWVHYKENGQFYYYQVDTNGNILYDKPPTTTKTIAPVYRWEGLWQEGIILTLSDMAKSMWDKKSIILGFRDKWNSPDEKLLNAYRSNIKLFGYDLIMFALIGSILGFLLGDWLEDLKKENKKNRDFITGLGISAANIAVMSVKNSFLDLNFIESVGSPIGQWTPFAFEWGSRTLSNWWNVAIGDEDFWDGVVKTSGGLKLIKPALDAIKPDMWRTEREGGTFNKK